MKAIVTKYHGATNTRGSRVSATAEGGNRVSLPWDSALNSDENHRKAALALVAKLKWSHLPLVSNGALPDGREVHVFCPELKAATEVLLEARRAIGLIQKGERGGYVMGALSKAGNGIDAFFAGVGYKTTEGGK